MKIYCTNDYEGLAQKFYNSMVNGTSVDYYIKELNECVKGYLKHKKSREYWLSFKPFNNPNPGPQCFANAIHNGEVNFPEKSIYVQGMKTQKAQFEAIEKAIIMYISGADDKLVKKTLKKIETRKAKLA